MFNDWMNKVTDDLQDGLNVHSIEEAEQLQAEFEKFKAGALQEAAANYDELNNFATSMAEMGSLDNPYTTLTPTVSINYHHNDFSYLPFEMQMPLQWQKPVPMYKPL